MALDAPEDLEEELVRIGVDPAAFPVLAAKRATLAIKFDDLPCSAAGILKQTALALGADCAVHRGVITGRKRRSDAILFATPRQLQRICERLREQPPAAQAAGASISALLECRFCKPQNPMTKSKCPASGVGHWSLVLGHCLVMGILNVTPDSFSDGGRYLRTEDAVAHGVELVKDGADILDIGAESTRPGAQSVTAKEELNRLLPVLRQLRRKIKVPISVDTTKSAVARACLAEGADIINDITGLQGGVGMAEAIATGLKSRIQNPKSKILCAVMHMKGTPRTMQRNPKYRDLMGEIYAFLERSVEIATRAGISRSQVIVDPGIGFGKTVEDNFTILRRLAELKSLGCPVMVGPSRKSFIGKTLDLPLEERLAGTLAACVMAVANGANILRVHDVREVKQALVIAEKILRKRSKHQ